MGKEVHHLCNNYKKWTHFLHQTAWNLKIKPVTWRLETHIMCILYINVPPVFLASTSLVPTYREWRMKAVGDAGRGKSSFPFNVPVFSASLRASALQYMCRSCQGASLLPLKPMCSRNSAVYTKARSSFFALSSPSIFRWLTDFYLSLLLFMVLLSSILSLCLHVSVFTQTVLLFC